jgi:hypothetical protein
MPFLRRQGKGDSIVLFRGLFAVIARACGLLCALRVLRTAYRPRPQSGESVTAFRTNPATRCEQGVPSSGRHTFSRFVFSWQVFQFIDCDVQGTFFEQFQFRSIIVFLGVARTIRFSGLLLHPNIAWNHPLSSCIAPCRATYLSVVESCLLS